MYSSVMLETWAVLVVMIELELNYVSYRGSIKVNSPYYNS